MLDDPMCSWGDCKSLERIWLVQGHIIGEEELGLPQLYVLKAGTLAAPSHPWGTDSYGVAVWCGVQGAQSAAYRGTCGALD